MEMAMDVAAFEHTHRETAKNVSSLPEAPFVASCLQQIEQNIHIYI
jgi:hypothetical protein